MSLSQQENIYRRQLYLQGMSDDELMKILQLSRSAVQKWRYKNEFTHSNRPKPKRTLDDWIDWTVGQAKELLEELKLRREKDDIQQRT